ncbi:hypothetical protein [Candidatus Poriferisocius sp.]|uniref:hypothetical protein n=1 Tax=Candidatus Poriferisocius sp. TaxID=3101276 RepID=UPI003B014ACA
MEPKGPKWQTYGTVRLWRCTTSAPEPTAEDRYPWKPGRKQGLIMAVSEYMACHLSFQLRHRMIFAKKRIRALVEGGAGTAEEMFPYMLCKGDARHQFSGQQIGQAVFGASEAEADAEAKRVYGPSGWWKPATWDEAFLELDDDALLDLARSVWSSNSSKTKKIPVWRRGRLHDLVPVAWRKIHSPRPECIRMQPVSRRLIVRTLRLAMIDPDYGTDRRAGPWADRKPKLELDAIRELHGPNIGDKAAEEIFHLIGGGNLRFLPAQRRGLQLLFDAYGVKAEDLSWDEAAALWEAGPEEMRRAKIERGLGRRDMLERAIRE